MRLDRDYSIYTKEVINAEVGATTRSIDGDGTYDGSGSKTYKDNLGRVLKPVAAKVFCLPEELKEQTRSELNRKRKERL